MRMRNSLKSWLTGIEFFMFMLLWRHRYKKDRENKINLHSTCFYLLNIFSICFFK